MLVGDGWGMGDEEVCWFWMDCGVERKEMKRLCVLCSWRSSRSVVRLDCSFLVVKGKEMSVCPT